MKIKIGHKLLAIREERAMTQAEMAHLLGVSEASYSRYERDKLQVSYDNIVKFAELLNISLSELLPENMGIQSNNNHNSGLNGNSIFFGSQYVYIGDNIANSNIAKEKEELSKENTALKEKLNALEQKLEEVLRKLSSPNLWRFSKPQRFFSLI